MHTTMSLLDIPSELLTLIADCLGPSELRKSVAYLLITKRWYHAALPVYLSQLPLTDLYLASHHDLDRFPPPDTALTNLIQTKTKRLSVRLVGHPSKRSSLLPWYDNTGLEHLEEQDEPLLGQDGAKKWESWDCDWMTVGPKGDTASRRTRWHCTYISDLLLFVWEQIAATLHVSGTEESLISPKSSYYMGEFPKLCLFSRVSIPRRVTKIRGTLQVSGAELFFAPLRCPISWGESQSSTMK